MMMFYEDDDDDGCGQKATDYQAETNHHSTNQKQEGFS
jgi:hypothetical protein